MCWECNKRKIKLTVDSADKTVYKILAWNKSQKQLTAWYMFNSKYNLGCTYRSQIEIIQSSAENGTVEVHKGLHSHSEMPKKYKNAIGAGGRGYYTSFTDMPLVAECIIPAGTLYGVGMNNEIVSTILQIKRIIPWEILTFIPGAEEDVEYAKEYKEIYNLIYSNKTDCI